MTLFVAGIVAAALVHVILAGDTDEAAQLGVRVQCHRCDQRVAVAVYHWHVESHLREERRS